MTAAVAVAIGMLLAAAWTTPLTRLETWARDWRLARPHHAPPVDDFMIVAIEQSTFERIEHWGPASLRRSAYVRVIDALASAGARSIGIDIFFSGDADHADDAALAAALARAGDVVLVAGAEAQLAEPSEGGERRAFAPPPEQISSAARAIASPLLFRPDSVIRSVHTLQDDADTRTAWFALSRAVLLETVKGIPDDVLINWAGPAGTVTRMRFEEVHDDPDAAAAARGRIVLLGVTDDMKDLFQTPVGPMSGVEIHAQAAATMLSGRYISEPPAAVSLLIALPATIFIALFGRGRPHWMRWAIAAALAAAWAVAAAVIFRRSLIMLPVTGPVLAMLATGVVVSAMHSEAAVRSLSRLWPGWALPEGEQLEVTVLVCDMAGYTARSERLQPSEMMALMREFFAIVDEVVGRHGGVSARRPGDAAVVFFRPHAGEEHHAARAVRAAEELQERLAEHWPDDAIGFGITLTTGEVSLGWVGEAPPEPQILGDPVNVAFRMQSECRERVCPILTDWPTASADQPTMARMRPLGQVEIRNRVQPVQIFTPVPAPSPPAQAADRS